MQACPHNLDNGTPIPCLRCWQAQDKARRDEGKARWRGAFDGLVYATLTTLGALAVLGCVWALLVLVLSL